jgi:hypothetical protein
MSQPLLSLLIITQIFSLSVNNHCRSFSLMKKNQKIKAAPQFPKNNAPRRKENELGATGGSYTIKCDYRPLRLRAGCLRQRFLCFWLRMHYFLNGNCAEAGIKYTT